MSWLDSFGDLVGDLTKTLAREDPLLIIEAYLANDVSLLTSLTFYTERRLMGLRWRLPKPGFIDMNWFTINWKVRGSPLRSSSVISSQPSVPYLAANIHWDSKISRERSFRAWSEISPNSSSTPALLSSQFYSIFKASNFLNTSSCSSSSLNFMKRWTLTSKLYGL